MKVSFRTISENNIICLSRLCHCLNMCEVTEYTWLLLYLYYILCMDFAVYSSDLSELSICTQKILDMAFLWVQSDLFC